MTTTELTPDVIAAAMQEAKNVEGLSKSLGAPTEPREIETMAEGLVLMCGAVQLFGAALLIVMEANKELAKAAKAGGSEGTIH